MPSALWTLVLIGLFLNTGISITLNTCIVIAAARSLKNRVKVSPVDVIHLVMGLVNLLLQGCLTVQSLLFVLFVSVLFIREVYLPLTVLILTLIYFSSWLNVWLSSYYCTSISNFTHQPFLWFKRFISTSLWPFLLLPAVGSLIISISSIWALNVEVETSSNNSTGRSSFIKGTFYFSRLYVEVVTVLGCFMPFMITLLSILLTFSSLTRHMKKMQQNCSGFTRQVHLNAIRKMSRLLVLSIFFCTSQLMFFSSRPSSSLDALVTTSWFLILSFPTVDSIIIIQASSKIQKIMMKIFCAWKQ